MKSLIPALMLSGCCAVAFVPALAAAQDAPAVARAPATLTVSGSGEVSAAPDMATVSLGVSTQAKTAAEALSQNSDAVQKLLDALAAAGVEARDIQTTGLNLNPVRDNSRSASGEPPEVVGYDVSNTVTVRVRKLDQLGGLLDQMVGEGANQLYGLSFGLSDSRDLEDQARQKAVEEAMRKAGLMAGAAGMTLGRVVSLTEGGASQGGPSPMYARDAAMAVPVAEGEVSVSASVSVTFVLEE